MRKTQESINGRPLEFITSQPLLFVATAHSSMNGLALPLCDAYNASRARVQAMQAGLDLRLGDMIRSRRIELGLTQAEVARRAQIS